MSILQVVGVLMVRPEDPMVQNEADWGLGYAADMLIDA